MTVLPVRPGQLAASFAGALLLTVCLIGAAQAKDSLAASKFVTIPIYYVTDREQKGETFGNRRRYPSECQHHMYYGTAMVTVPNKDLKIIDDRLKALGWQAADHRGGKISPKEMIDSKHPLVGRMTFLHRLVEALDKESKVTTASSEGSVGHLEAATTAPRATPTTAEAATIAPRATATTPEVASAHESAAAHATIPALEVALDTTTKHETTSAHTPEPQLCLFVHGAADAFEDCVDDAGLLAYGLEKPLVLYSWPSDPHLRGYFIDGTNIEWSQKHFNLFCRDLLELKAEHPMEMICLSHSMGNRMVIRALPILYGRELVSDWEMISPDIDADTCRHYLMGYRQTKAKIRLYVSNKDLILPFTQMINGGYYRVGEAANPAWEITKRKRAEYLERIDFTLVDKGWYGHSLPFDLVANMVHNDKPGKGFALVPETSVRANGFAHFAGRSEGLAATSSEADFCSRLIKVKIDK